MIAQLLNRNFVLEQLQDVQDKLAALQGSIKGAVWQSDLPVVDPGEMRAAHEDVSAAIEREKKESSGQATWAGTERTPGTPLEDFSFFSRDPLINNLQSTLEMYLRVKEPHRLVKKDQPDDRRSAALPPAVTDESIRAWIPRKTPSARRIFEKFSTLDAGWVSCKLAQRWAKHKGPHSFIPPPRVEESLPVPDQKLRLILVGDWATGLPRARRVSSAMRSVIELGKRNGFAQHVIHLGDTYYSGWPEEYEKRFLPYWPVDHWETDEIGSWSLNGNHDMYSGGYGYYDTLLRDIRFHRQKGNSMFSLHNGEWQIVGLDSSYLDEDLKDQAPWIDALLKHSNRKFLLLSHHQLFSTWEKAGAHLQNTIAPALASKRIKVWFWGHEHRCVIYKPHMGVDFGRCIGHGGVPVYNWRKQKDPYPDPAVWEYRDRLPGKLQPWAYMGFAVLDFDGPKIDVKYYNENGVNHKHEQLH